MTSLDCTVLTNIHLSVHNNPDEFGISWLLLHIRYANVMHISIGRYGIEMA